MPTPVAAPPKYLDPAVPPKVSYCIPTALRDEQIKIALRKVKGRIAGPAAVQRRSEPIAVVCFGPSLNDTWDQVRRFKRVISCSGSHKFLIEHGIVPTWHVEVDPRPHKIALLGTPHPDVEYLIASACHPRFFDHLAGFKVKLWHVFDSAEEGLRILPPGEWALRGGSSVGLRAMTIARCLGFTDLHIFGMDGCEGASGKHAAVHPNQPKGHSLTMYDGVEYRTTPSLLACALETFPELDKMPDVRATFYGEGLVQAMARKYVPKPIPAEEALLGFAKPELISPAHRAANRELHETEPAYGSFSAKHADLILRLYRTLKADSVLDYGSGKGALARALPMPIWEYDPAIPGKEETPRPADIVVCIDVLEHVEPDRLDFVLDDLRRCAKRVGVFIVHSGAAQKVYPDGRNTHLIQRPLDWWKDQLGRFFAIGKARQILVSDKPRSWDGKPHYEYHFIVGPKPLQPAKPLRRWDVLEALVLQHGWRRGVEVGVKDGPTFLHLLGHCPLLHLTGVDLFEPRPGIEREGGESFLEANLPWHEKRLRQVVATKHADHAAIIKGDSVTVAATFADASLDFAFIDADHREAAVRADILAWRPKIKPGGMLLGHDAQPKFPGVLAAINALCPGWVKYADSVWGVRC